MKNGFRNKMKKCKVIQENSLMKKIMIGIFFILPALLLNGCASMSAPPKCPDSTGLTCARVDQIDAMLSYDQMSLPNNNAVPVPAPTRYRSSVNNQNNAKTVRMWMAPYIDKAGRYHPAGHADVQK